MWRERLRKNIYKSKVLKKKAEKRKDKNKRIKLYAKARDKTKKARNMTQSIQRESHVWEI
jgi:hypothetical protein